MGEFEELMRIANSQARSSQNVQTKKRLQKQEKEIARAEERRRQDVIRRELEKRERQRLEKDKLESRRREEQLRKEHAMKEGMRLEKEKEKARARARSPVNRQGVRDRQPNSSNASMRDRKTRNDIKRPLSRSSYPRERMRSPPSSGRTNSGVTGAGSVYKSPVERPVRNEAPVKKDMSYDQLLKIADNNNGRPNPKFSPVERGIGKNIGQREYSQTSKLPDTSSSTLFRQKDTALKSSNPSSIRNRTREDPYSIKPIRSSNSFGASAVPTSRSAKVSPKTSIPQPRESNSKSLASPKRLQQKSSIYQNASPNKRPKPYTDRPVVERRGPRLGSPNPRPSVSPRTIPRMPDHRMPSNRTAKHPEQVGNRRETYRNVPNGRPRPRSPQRMPANRPRPQPSPRERIKKQYSSDEESESDDSMDDFIVDDEDEEDYGSRDAHYSLNSRKQREGDLGQNSVTAEIHRIFGYNKNRYQDVDEDDIDNMESSATAQLREESRSTRIAREEDKREEQLELERERRIRERRLARQKGL